MSLGVVIKGPEGVVLACDSRITLAAQREGEPIITVNFDNARKMFGFEEPHNYFGIITYGQALIGLRTAHSFIPELENILNKDIKRKSIEEYAGTISDFYQGQWEKTIGSDYDGPPMIFIIGGYDEKDAYPKVYLFEVPSTNEPVEQHPGAENFGPTWGGQLEIASRLIHGFDPRLRALLKTELNLDDGKLVELMAKLQEKLQLSIPYQVLPLQDSVDLAKLMIQTTLSGQNLSVGRRGVGGPIDIAVVTKVEGLKYIQKKELKV